MKSCSVSSICSWIEHLLMHFQPFAWSLDGKLAPGKPSSPCEVIWYLHTWHQYGDNSNKEAGNSNQSNRYVSGSFRGRCPLIRATWNDSQFDLLPVKECPALTAWPIKCLHWICCLTEWVAWAGFWAGYTIQLALPGVKSKQTPCSSGSAAEWPK